MAKPEDRVGSDYIVVEAVAENQQQTDDEPFVSAEDQMIDQ